MYSKPTYCMYWHAYICSQLFPVATRQGETFMSQSHRLTSAKDVHQFRYMSFLPHEYLLLAAHACISGQQWVFMRRKYLIRCIPFVDVSP